MGGGGATTLRRALARRNEYTLLAVYSILIITCEGNYVATCTSLAGTLGTVPFLGGCDFPKVVAVTMQILVQLVAFGCAPVLAPLEHDTGPEPLKQ